MAAQNSESVPSLIEGLLQDARDLIRQEIALARAEVREEVTHLQSVGIAFGSAIVAAVLGATMLCFAVAVAIDYYTRWPAWTGYGIVTVLLFIGAVLLLKRGQANLAKIRALPQTTESVKENLTWMQSKSEGR
jgi:hypothetical protein